MPTATAERRSTGSPVVRIEGGLFDPDFFERLRGGRVPGQAPRDLGIGDRSLLEEIAAAYHDAKRFWEAFQSGMERLPEGDFGTTLTRERWIIPLLSLLGYRLVRNPRAYVIDNQTFAISHRAGENDDAPPVHIAGCRQDLDRRPPERRGPRLSPHSLVQEFLNRTEHLWGVVTNGLRLRLLRKSHRVRGQAYVEFDLAAIFEENRFRDFELLFRLLHRSRLPKGLSDAADCLLERYYIQAIEEGSRARDRLRDSVVKALQRLGQGFLRHPKNGELRKRALEGGTAFAHGLYQELLRLVYRFLFLLVAEERDLLGGSELYREHYSVSRLRRLVDNRRAHTQHGDLWYSLRVLWHLLRDHADGEDGEPPASLLGLPVLDGKLFEPLAVLGECELDNRSLLEAFRHLHYCSDECGVPRRINYAHLDVEELGSVYESLLDYQPRIAPAAGEGDAGISFELIPGTERRSTGSYYTPRELVAELVDSALGPVLEERLSRATTPEEKERAILSIKVCDPATGSGHFLLAAARRLGEELARVRTGEEEPAPAARREAVREVISHCIYGVDKNALAVELCKVALWIESHAPGKPLAFLDHRIRCGDSLVGVFDLGVLEEGIPDSAYKPVTGDDPGIARALRNQNRADRREVTVPFKLPADITYLAEGIAALDSLGDDTPEAIGEKAARYRGILDDPRFRRDHLACDLWTAAFFAPLTPETQGKVPTSQDLRRLLEHGEEGVQGEVRDFVRALAEKHKFFHWPLEFPEVFAQGGFDVVLGNPPFMGGLKISRALGGKYRHWLTTAFAPYKGTADLCSVFYRRVFDLLRSGGRMGMVATSTIGQGDTRESGLKVIVEQGGTITFARRFIKWPGAANVEVNLVAIHKPDGSPATHRSPLLDGQPVDFISSRLDAEPEAEPKRLPQNEGKAFQGDIVRGIGFVLEPEETEALLAKDPRNADCLFPYLNGEDLNSHPEQKPSRWVICFHDWDLERAKQYPDLLRIVEERVKPERERLRNRDDRRDRECWWRFARYRGDMRLAIAPLRRVLVRAQVSEMHQMVFVPKGWIYSMMVIVFAFDDDYHFALLQSSVHEVWLRKQASSLRTDIRYTPTDCFATFPFPPEDPTLTRFFEEPG
ncbi:MAG TPA: SAM-dependent DNA methyltransferase [Anaerolineales bacterium]|nr:SAM-dependent DNA methyltransferase [Anaerolineales bacterium]